MDQSSSSLGGSTGGTVPTGNPQNIGSQSLGAPTGNLQSQTQNLNTNSNATLLGLDGKPVKTTTSSTTQPITSTNNHKATYIGLYILVFLVVFVISWRRIKSNSQP